MNGFPRLMKFDVNRVAMARYGLILRQNVATTHAMPLNLFLTSFSSIFNLKWRKKSDNAIFPYFILIIYRCGVALKGYLP